MIIRICKERSWDFAKFFSLPTSEQDTLIAYEQQREETIHRAIDKAYGATTDGKLYAEVLTARLLGVQVIHGW